MFGYNYDPRKDVLTWVNPEEALYNFYCQMCTGDTVDNIPGIPGVGPKWVEKNLTPPDVYFEGVEDPYPDLADYLYYVLDIVERRYGEKGMDLQYYLEQGRLLHMRRRPDEVWDENYDWFSGYDDACYGEVEVFSSDA